MLYCHNPECPYLKRVGHVAEYEDDATQCSDCLAALHDAPPVAEDPRAEEVLEARLNWDEMTRLGRLGDEAMILAVESILTQADIQYAIHGRGVQDLLGAGRIGAGYNVFSGAPILFVETARADEARQLLSVLEEGEA